VICVPAFSLILTIERNRIAYLLWMDGCHGTGRFERADPHPVWTTNGKQPDRQRNVTGTGPLHR